MRVGKYNHETLGGGLIVLRARVEGAILRAVLEMWDVSCR